MAADFTSNILDALSGLRPSQWCQLGFVLPAALILCLRVFPHASRRLLLDYGPRRRDDGAESGAGTEGGSGKVRDGSGGVGEDHGGEGGLFDAVLRAVTSRTQTPHAWFTHFYVLSVAGSIFWGWELFRRGPALRILAEKEVDTAKSSSWSSSWSSSSSSPESGVPLPPPCMGAEQVMLVWALMALQGARRLYECWFVMRPSRSSMWFAHWLLGLFFYLNVGVSVWIEGSYSVLNPPDKLDLAVLISPGTILGLLLFCSGWCQQYWCHAYLASLKKYTLPDRGLFRYVVCAHYTCECVLYLGLAIVAAPAGQWRNRTLWCALLFVVVNLGSTAGGTKQWYEEKFGSKRVSGKWKMIPFVF